MLGQALVASALLYLPASAGPAPPPGHNVHLVRETPSGVFWRGGAPTRETLGSLAKSARARGRTVTLIDLRQPPSHDDLSGKAGRLAPAAEAKTARELGMSYLPVSALDRRLPDRIEAALGKGDVYMHCMYGVNRTGFATARYARAEGIRVDASKLGPRDWKQGERFQNRLGVGR